ncbi:MAG: hypothetical protein V4749_20485 [Pseudomonadota bacterium]
MKRVIVGWVLAVCVLGAGWYLKEPNTFTFTVDMPEGFKYKAVVYYVPAPGETCKVAMMDNKAPVFNYWWREEYKPDSEIEIRRTRKGCSLVVYNVKLDIFAKYGSDRGDFGATTAQLVILEKLQDESDREYFDIVDKTVFFGECGWTFKTSGGRRRIIKLLNCKDINIGRPSTPGRPVAGYTLDQLPGKTIEMKILLSEEESPSMDDTWVKVPNGWKRCMGKGFEDPYAFCRGNHKDFSHFLMVDGRQCTIYPGCTE